MKRLYYLRHGQSVLNTKARFAGLTNTRLTKVGEEQAKTAGQKAKGISIDIIICSPLLRTKETARLFAEGAGLNPSLIKTNALLVERDFGSLEKTKWTAGRSHTLVNDDLPEGVEPWDHMVKRGQELIDFVSDLPVDNVLLVGHGSIGRAIRSIVEPSADIHAGIPNAELVRWI